MKALSVRQPWASLIVGGHKTLEIRSWRTNYRGPLVICASMKTDGCEACARLLPHGCALGVVEIVDCRPLALHDSRAACFNVSEILPEIAYAWVLRGARAFSSVVPNVKGRLGFFDVPATVLRRVA